MMTPTSSAGSSASVWSSATPAGGGYGGGNRTATLQQLSGFGMRNLALQGTVAGHLLSVYFKLGSWRGSPLLGVRCWSFLCLTPSLCA